MASKKFLDLDKYKNIAKNVSPETLSIIPKKSAREINGEILITSEDGSQNSANIWFSVLNDRESVMVHCPISPESHNNNDANPSCSMSKNGAYLNLKCFGCGRNDSLYFPSKKKRQKGGVEYVYILPDFDKESAKQELTRDLSAMSSIVTELVRLLPALEKVEVKDD